MIKQKTKNNNKSLAITELQPQQKTHFQFPEPTCTGSKMEHKNLHEGKNDESSAGSFLLCF